MARAARVALDLALATTSTLKPALGTIWQYAKVELTPPMTQTFFQGAAIRKLENSVSASANGFIALLRESIKQIDTETAIKIQEKQAAIQAELERKKAEAKKKEEEMKLKAEAAKKEKAKEKQTSDVKATENKEVKPKASKDKKKKDARKVRQKKREVPKKVDVPKNKDVPKKTK